ncbi:hypothetical protein G3O08_15190 [Cryomorpha ignava]|uniref:Sensor of ECF-type sigma factor n=1 Tax=Cryomorpha ignava TaxID=101383 RepID=A0A7K3WTP4_9FLAO|nr:hypothetical protein [Cryomorpha ignava]NEN24846.1 hypothetical protein [Cryomorpha ignava]
MKLNIVIIALLSFFQLTLAQGQNPDKRTARTDIEAQKVAFITSELNLTPQEAQEFWPMYNAYRTDLQKLRKGEIMRQSDRLQSDSKLSDKELDAEMKKEFANDRHKIDLDEKYYELFKTVLPVSKVVAFYKAERDFKRELLKVLKERRD